jgi:large subunit ribosomal protein L21
MYAIVSIAGQQFKVEKNKKVFVHRLPDEVGTVKEFDKVILIDNEGKIKLGKPFIDNALVTAKIVSHLKGDKVLVFKKKRRKGYRKMNGHRQYLTEILIDDILENAASRKAAPVTGKEKKAEPEKAQTAVKETVVEAKPQQAKKPAVKKAEKTVPKSEKTAPKAEKVQPKAKKAAPKAEKAQPKAKKAAPKAEKAVKGTTKAGTKTKPDAGKVKKTAPEAKSAKKQSEDKK